MDRAWAFENVSKRSDLKACRRRAWLAKSRLDPLRLRGGLLLLDSSLATDPSQNVLIKTLQTRYVAVLHR